MAAIEKICELSGEYPGYLMYGYKRNQLQIMPKYRKLFRGAEHTLIIRESDLKFCDKNTIQTYDDQEWTEYDPPFVNENDFIRWKKENGYFLKVEYKYTLTVKDKNLQGRVNGEYMNWSCDLPTVKRKLKRLLRCRKLNIIGKKNDNRLYGS